MNTTSTQPEKTTDGVRIVLKPRLQTANQQLSILLCRLIRSAAWHLRQATAEARLWRESTGKTWNAADYPVWSRVFSSRTEAMVFFRTLRETLHPADYHAALQAAREATAQIRQRQETAANF